MFQKRSFSCGLIAGKTPFVDVDVHYRNYSITAYLYLLPLHTLRYLIRSLSVEGKLPETYW